MSQSEAPVWLITGCSTGFGRLLAEQVLERGWRAVVSARDKNRVADLERDHPDAALAVALDVSDPSQVQASVAAALERFGRIDVLVNNAGYGYQASVEEGVDSEIRAMFEANVFGLAAMTRAVLPGMRERRRGHVVNISSLAGFVGFPGSGYYAATKHAVEGLSDSLAAEVAPSGIHVTCVEPGPFRTDWAGRSLKQTATQIKDYGHVADRLRATSKGSGSQPGDPARAAAAIIAAVQSEAPPRHLVLGRMALDKVREVLDSTRSEVEAWRQAGLDTDYPDARGA